MKTIALSITLFAVCLFAGCGGEPKPTLIPASGTLTINGKPAGDIMVQFVPNVLDEKINAPMSQALTDAQGNFELVTMKNEKGAYPGEHKVTLIDTLEERPAQGEEASVTSRLDQRFTTGAITVEVVEGQPIKLEANGPN